MHVGVKRALRGLSLVSLPPPPSVQKVLAMLELAEREIESSACCSNYTEVLSRIAGIADCTID
jgi:hypothetical protein